MEELLIDVSGPVRGTVRPPGSKSITNRAVVCAGLAAGTSHLDGPLDSEDTAVMINAWRQLGATIEWNSLKSRLTVQGRGGRLANGPRDLYVENSGTTIRFLAAVTALGRGRYRLDGNERMRQRPIGDLLQALRGLGIAMESEYHNDCPPVVIDARGLVGGETTVAGDVSSQFLSGLLLAAPAADGPVTIRLTSPLVSRPYVRMTIGVMQAFGVQVVCQDERTFRVAPQPYQPTDLTIEPDASAASYFWAAAAVTGGKVTVAGLSRSALQGDVAFMDCLARMGCEVAETRDGLRVSGRARQGIDVDMRDISDTVPTLAVVALFVDGVTTIRGVGHIRHKETDRIRDLATELRKLGAGVAELPDGLRIQPRTYHPATLATYRDHRMAMSLSLAGLRIPGVRILDPDCTAKTYPRFFADLAAIRRGR